MLLTKEIKIIVNPMYDKKYHKLGYYILEDYKNVDSLEITISIEHLNHTDKKYVEVQCDICNEIKSIQYYNYCKNIAKYGIYTCNQQCAQIKNKRTNLERYGTESPLSNINIINKRKNTLINKFGVDNVMKVKEIKAKANQTLYNKFGVTVPMKNENIKKKQQDTMESTYGSKFSMQVDDILQKSLTKHKDKSDEVKQEIKDKRETTMLNNYGVTNIAHSEEHKNKIYEQTKIKYHDVNILYIKDDIYTIECDCGHTVEINYHNFLYRYANKSTICTTCNPINSKKSGAEFAFRQFISSVYGGEIQINKRILNNKELDVYLPELKLAFEFNGLYWHSEEYLPTDYHKNKSDECKRLGIELIHIYDDDWVSKTDIVKTIVKKKIGIVDSFNNKHSISLVDKAVATVFLEENNILGYVDNDINIGIYVNGDDGDDGVLISILSLKSNENGFDIVGVCDNKYMMPVDGFHYMFNFLIRNFKMNYVTFLVDRDFGYIDGLIECGFELIETTPPSSKYIVNGKRISFGCDVASYSIYNSGYNIYVYRS